MRHHPGRFRHMPLSSPACIPPDMVHIKIGIHLQSNWPRQLGTPYDTRGNLADHGYQQQDWLISGVTPLPDLLKGLPTMMMSSSVCSMNLITLVSINLSGDGCYLDEIAGRWGVCGYRRAHQMNARVFSWLEGYYQSPFLLFIHYFDPHLPYIPPYKYYRHFQDDEHGEMTKSERYKRELVAKYDGELAYLDDHLGKLFTRLKALNLYDNSMIIITSDHGEFFGEHDMWIHGYELYQEVLKVPLIIKYPASFPKQGEYSKRVSLVDIMPTLLNFLGLPLSHESQGRELFKEGNRVMAEIYRGTYTEIYDLFIDRYVKNRRFRKEERLARQLKTLYLDNYKYIKEFPGISKSQDELYDIESDPAEAYNLIDTRPEKAKEMEVTLTRWLDFDGPPSAAPQAAPLDKQTEEGLRALGYIQ